MGLDQFLYKTRLSKEKYDILKDLIESNIIEDNHEEICYLRKVPRLQGFMEKLYYATTDNEKMEFNCVRLYLSEKDIDNLEQVVDNSYFGESNEEKINNNVPKNSGKECLCDCEGFFFGSSTYEEEDKYRGFIQAAREALEEGCHIFYYSWW